MNQHKLINGSSELRDMIVVLDALLFHILRDVEDAFPSISSVFFL